MSDKIVEWAKELQSLAQAGLFYGRDAFDRERYQGTPRSYRMERFSLSVKRMGGGLCPAAGVSTIYLLRTIP